MVAELVKYIFLSGPSCNAPVAVVFEIFNIEPGILALSRSNWAILLTLLSLILAYSFLVSAENSIPYALTELIRATGFETIPVFLSKSYK